MELSSRGRNNEPQVLVSRTRVWSEQQPKNGVAVGKVPVVYYLSRKGQLEHPHFMEVPLSSNDGLFLHDVINRLNLLRGKGFASLYSWSSKRSYKNGFVWNDLTENDFIHPANCQEYVLKGSEILDSGINPTNNLPETTSVFSSSQQPPQTHKSSSGEESDCALVAHRRNQSWSSINLNEYKVYKAESVSELTRKLAADASTQTDDRRRRRRPAKREEGEIEELHGEKGSEPEANREEIEISPPPSDSSPETLESLMKADGRLKLSSGSGNEEGADLTAENCGRTKASTVLRNLISCGSMSFRDCGATAVKEQGLSLVGHYKGRMPRGGIGDNHVHVGTSREILSFPGVKLEDREYFSGSLIETQKGVPTLKRSNSYNADRSSQLAGKQIDEAQTKCIPRKSLTAMSSKKEFPINLDGDQDSHQW